MSFSEWKEEMLSDVIEFNPSEKIVKDTMMKKVSMEKISPCTRKIYDYEETVFNGGSKFRNGDTLMARITPCLENGKIAQVDILDDGEVGFGSTEFIVMREKVGKTINDFVYYLSISNQIKNKAIQSMTGTSGRQRVQNDVLFNYKLFIPPIHEQRAIAATLTCIDDLIEQNKRTNKILDEMTQAIFKHWFVDFEFQNEDDQPYKSSGGKMVDSELGLIPLGWQAVELGNVTINMRDKTRTNDFRVLSAVNTGNLKLSEEYFTKQVFSKDLSKYIIVRNKEFAYNPARVNIGSIGMNEYNFDGCVSPVYVVFKAEEDYHWFFKLFIKTDNFKSEVIKRASGSVRQAMNYCDFALIKTVYPPKSVIDKFNQIFEVTYFAQKELTKEIEILINIRDILLPKLISGEILLPVEEGV
ncbi:restriction endonuclease subunit S [Dehalobacter sp.]|uniref:restriction endonuclease subunit S n=1 Tax=Dehalobacter sp. TaxID=1962289 RepID=UPI002587E86D|nr:restriction endonuclease subunit S [Dehalobacter sp.]MDJ0304741.1 restriction endonuclease subunit S [Dehalobacter sp.]